MSRQRGQPIDGIVLLDKPVGLSSNAALQAVKRLYQACKAGHTGSLDPLASGLLPICLGEATKLAGMLLNAAKRYEFTCRLGVTTRTGDSEGEELANRPVGPLTADQVETVLAGFRGEIEQQPPMYSAIKQQGRRLYALARQGITVERQPRRVVIHDLRLLQLAGDQLSCAVHCSKGTYIRSLAADIGEALGCGAHIVALRRTGVEPFNAAQMVTLDELRERAAQGPAALQAVLLLPDTAVAPWPAVRVSDDLAHYVMTGQPLWVPRAPTQGWVRLYGGERFLGIGEILEDGRVAPRRLLQLKV